MIERDGVQAYEGSVRYVNAVRAAGLRTAIVSSSANTEAVLKAAGVDGLFEVRVDHQVAEARQAARQARARHVPRGGADARRRPRRTRPSSRTRWPGWPPGDAGNFGFVVGVDRVGQADQLRAHGADVVVKDLAELL